MYRPNNSSEPVSFQDAFFKEMVLRPLQNQAQRENFSDLDSSKSEIPVVWAEPVQDQYIPEDWSEIPVEEERETEASALKEEHTEDPEEVIVIEDDEEPEKYSKSALQNLAESNTEEEKDKSVEEKICNYVLYKHTLEPDEDCQTPQQTFYFPTTIPQLQLQQPSYFLVQSPELYFSQPPKKKARHKKDEVDPLKHLIWFRCVLCPHQVRLEHCMKKHLELCHKQAGKSSYFCQENESPICYVAHHLFKEELVTYNNVTGATIIGKVIKCAFCHCFSAVDWAQMATHLARSHNLVRLQ